ncbi:DEAD/DEAH box helicase [Fictibacillus iocasae]|uniref:DEAD/DEAH box helicase n=1 Tax=Fictibacillus iocasae TaxID=2715437 RepID=A0ABW2NMB5_9BACL
MNDMNQFPVYIQQAWEKAGFGEPTAVQKEVFGSIGNHQDMIIESPTGTGKTLAYLLPALLNVSADVHNAQLVILAPTRELAMQIYEVCQQFTAGSGLTGASLIGGANLQRQLDKLKKKPQYIVGTPGRVREILQLKKLKMQDVKTIVVDEADSIVESGLKGEIEQIIKSTFKERQLMFVSATITNKAEEWAKSATQNAQVIRVKKDQLPESDVTHFYMVSEMRDKAEALRKIIKNISPLKAIVFVNGSTRLDEVAAKLEYRGASIGVLAGNSSKEERQKVMREFRSDKVPVLMTTDVAARGLDVSDVTHVIHYDQPEDDQIYVHRSGRTGRMGKSGAVISLVTKNEEFIVKKWAQKLNLHLEKKSIIAGEITNRGSIKSHSSTKDSHAKKHPAANRSVANHNKRSEKNDRNQRS